MEGKRCARYVWLLMAVAIAFVVAENGKMCRAFDMEEAKEKTGETVKSVEDEAGSWGGWVKEKFTGKWSLGDNMKDNSQDMMDKVSNSASDASKYVSGKAHDAKEKVKGSTQ